MCACVCHNRVNIFVVSDREEKRERVGKENWQEEGVSLPVSKRSQRGLKEAQDKSR